MRNWRIFTEPIIKLFSNWRSQKEEYTSSFLSDDQGSTLQHKGFTRGDVEKSTHANRFFLAAGITYLVLFPLILNLLMTSRDNLVDASMELLRLQTALNEVEHEPISSRLQEIRSLALFMEENTTLIQTTKVDPELKDLHTRISKLLTNRASATEHIETIKTLIRSMSKQINEESELQGRAVDAILVMVIIVLGLSLIISLNLLSQLHGEKNRRVWDKETAEKLLTHEETLRSQLSRDLHDDLAQTLAMAKIHAGPEAQPYISTAIEKIRSLSRSLSLPRVSGKGFGDMVEQLVDGYRESVDFTLLFGLTGTPLAYRDDMVNTQLFRVIQECLQNAQKHSRASQVSIALRSTQDSIIFRYEDDGIGLHETDLETSVSINSGQGLGNIQDRIKIIHGNIFFNKNSSGGLSIQAEIPVSTPVKKEI